MGEPMMVYPRPTLEVRGEPFPAELLGFQLEEAPNTPSRCVLMLAPSGSGGQDPQTPPGFGDAVAVSMEAPGSGAGPERLFLGRILGFGRVRDRGGHPGSRWRPPTPSNPWP